MIFRGLQTVETHRRARTMALHEKTHANLLPTAKYGPPPSQTAEQLRPRPSIVPGSFVIVVVRTGP
jgi:hypothetical protein